MSSSETRVGPDSEREAGGVQAVTRALAVLACFRDGSPDLGVSDIARALELKPSTAHRLVRTLVRAGFLEQDVDTSRYRLGNALAEYGQIVYHQRRVHLAVPYLSRLSLAVGENAALAIRHGSDALLLSGAQAPWSDAHEVTGLRIPLHASAMGKVLLAWGGDRTVDPAVIGPLTPATDRTITDVSELRRELERVAEAGWALNDEEMAPGIRTVAVPVFDDTGLAAFALGIRGPVGHLPDERIPLLVERARETAALIQAALR
jgi:IclR family transcriptional regulator, acetate operon repressor